MKLNILKKQLIAAIVNKNIKNSNIRNAIKKANSISKNSKKVFLLLEEFIKYSLISAAL